MGARWNPANRPRARQKLDSAPGIAGPQRRVPVWARARPIGGIPSRPHGHFGPESAQNQPSTACCVCCYESACCAATATSRELDSYFSLKSQQKQMRLESTLRKTVAAILQNGILILQNEKICRSMFSHRCQPTQPVFPQLTYFLSHIWPGHRKINLSNHRIL